MADPKAPGKGFAPLNAWQRDVERRLRDKEAPSGTQKNMTTAKVFEALERIEAQQLQIIEVQQQQAAQIAYLQGLTVSTARSTTGALDVAANSWATDARLRVSRTLRTTTGKLRITVGGTVASCAALYSIDGYVNRDDLIASAGILDTLNSNDPAYYIGGSKVYTVEGLPLNTDLTVRTEVRGLSNAGAAARMSLIVEVIP